MTREEIVRGLNAVNKECGEHLDESFAWMVEIFQAAIGELEQKPCEDAVSRQAVRDVIMKCETMSEDTMDGYIDSTTKLETEIVCLPPVTPAQKWIPCNKRLPEEETDVLICNSKGNIEVSRGSVFDDGTWEWYTSGWHFGEVLAWMPLPKPYKVESEEK